MDGTTTPQEAYDMMAYQVSEGNLQGNFVTSMMSQFETKGRLSPKQITWAIKLSTEAAAKESDPMSFETEDEDEAFVGIANSFKVIASPKLIFSLGNTTSVRLTASPKHGKNPDHIYVKLNGDYAGKITPAGKFQNVRTLNWQALKTLVNMLGDIEDIGLSAYITHYGKDSGICCCCGRELTDPQSVSAGIGPVCAQRWNIARPSITIA